MKNLLLNTLTKQFREKSNRVLVQLTSAADAAELLYLWNHSIVVNDALGSEEPLPTGTYQVSRQTFEALVNIAAGNPMSDQRKDTRWSLNVDRGGLAARGEVYSVKRYAATITCSFPHYNKLRAQHFLRFEMA